MSLHFRLVRRLTTLVIVALCLLVAGCAMDGYSPISGPSYGSGFSGGSC